jgi:hypothetical protein
MKRKMLCKGGGALKVARFTPWRATSKPLVSVDGPIDEASFSFRIAFHHRHLFR